MHAMGIRMILRASLGSINSAPAAVINPNRNGEPKPMSIRNPCSGPRWNSSRSIAKKERPSGAQGNAALEASTRPSAAMNFGTRAVSGAGWRGLGSTAFDATAFDSGLGREAGQRSLDDRRAVLLNEVPRVVEFERLGTTLDHRVKAPHQPRPQDRVLHADRHE